MAIVLAQFNLPLFPALPYKFEFADVPLLVCTALLGPVYGLLSLGTAAIVENIIVDPNFIGYGFLMHFISSGLMILIVNYVRKHNEGLKGVIYAAICGIFVKTLAMIPLNIILIPMVVGIPRMAFIQDELTLCIVFNVIKATANILLYSLLAPIVEKEWHKLFKKNRKKQSVKEIEADSEVKDAE
jgi:riboflavin transporter FmnP